MSINEKLEALRSYIRDLGSVAVAFSSGVDSTLLLAVAHEQLGEKCIAVTAFSGAFPEREKSEATEFCKTRGIEQVFVQTNELELDEYRANPTNRCYICKKAIFGEITSVAAEHGINHIIEGSNVDDDGDYRPGMQAIKELGVLSPLKACGLTKAEIRELSKEFNLDTWDKQSFACLATRFVYGEEITKDKLAMVDKAEQLLIDMGFKQLRVRIHGLMARIEVMPDEMEKLFKDREIISAKLKEFGFTYVTMDMQGYRTGSMNEVM